MRIILADHHEQSRLALVTLLEEQPEIELVGEAEDAQSLLLLAKKHAANLVLVDGELPDIFMDELIAELHALEPRPVVIVMSCKVESGRRLLRAGADVFVSKVDEPDWLLERLQKYAEHFRLREAANPDQRP